MRLSLRTGLEHVSSVENKSRSTSFTTKSGDTTVRLRDGNLTLTGFKSARLKIETSLRTSRTWVFNDKIVTQANTIYSQVTQGQIFRGNSRKAIVFACIFHAYKLSGCPQGHEDLISIFGLNRKDGLKGLKHVNLHAPRDHKIHVTYITPGVLIDNVMKKFSATAEQKEEVRVIYELTRNRSSKLNRARPQSYCAGLIWSWLSTKHKGITLKEFARCVDLSELTIGKISKEVNIVLGNVQKNHLETSPCE